jgi:hypothetical protein
MTKILSLAGSGQASDLTVVVFRTMSRRGTLAATHVANLPQENGRGTPTEPVIRVPVQNATNVQRPNTGFAAYRGLQLPSQHHTSARRKVSRLAMTPTRTLGKWHGNWIISRLAISPGSVETTY